MRVAPQQGAPPIPSGLDARETHYKRPLMITVITRFPLPVGVPAAQIRAGYEHVAPAFRNIPGLIRKQFLLSPDGRTGGGVYLWSDEAAARAFMEGKVAPMIREKFKVEPQIEYFESPVIVEG
jgi:hypothetical protein